MSKISKPMRNSNAPQMHPLAGVSVRVIRFMQPVGNGHGDVGPWTREYAVAMATATRTGNTASQRMLHALPAGLFIDKS